MKPVALKKPRLRRFGRLGLGLLLASALFASAVPDARSEGWTNLRITKEGPASATVGGAIAYVIKVTNTGSVPAYDAFVEDYGRAPVKLGNATATQGSCNTLNNSILCSLGTIEPGASVTVTVPATVTHEGRAENLAAARAENGSTVISGAVYTQVDSATSVPDPVVAPSDIKGTAFKYGRRQKPLSKVVVCASRADAKVCSNPTGKDGAFAITVPDRGLYTLSATPRRGACMVGPIGTTSGAIFADPKGVASASVFCGRKVTATPVVPQTPGGGCAADAPVTGTAPNPAPGGSYPQTDSSGAEKGWLDKLLEDVKATGIDGKTYVADQPGDDENYDCDDFAGDLEKALEAKGYEATFTYMWCPDGAHAVTDVHAADGSVVWIEPQTAKRITDMDRNGDGKVGYDSTAKSPARDNPTEGDCRVEVYDSRDAAEAAGRKMDG